MGGSPTDIAQCPVTDTVGLGGGKLYMYNCGSEIRRIAESQHVTLHKLTLRF